MAFDEFDPEEQAVKPSVFQRKVPRGILAITFRQDLSVLLWRNVGNVCRWLSSTVAHQELRFVAPVLVNALRAFCPAPF